METAARPGRPLVIKVEPSRPCEVLIDGRWWAGLLHRWERRGDGTWWGLGFVEWHDWNRPKRYPDELRPATRRENNRDFHRTAASAQARNKQAAKPPEDHRRYEPPLDIEVHLDGRWHRGELTEARQDKRGDWWVWGHVKGGRWNRWIPAADRIREPP